MTCVLFGPLLDEDDVFEKSDRLQQETIEQENTKSFKSEGGGGFKAKTG
jgi:hypothetical protein